ncbi:MAG TPA: VOC family protein [Thermomonas sp.]|nr:VOC family protein [Thermomonas sp.]
MSVAPASITAIHPVLAARDVAASIRFYRRLGFSLSFQDDADAPKYAAVHRDGIELHLQWADAGQWVEGLDRPACRFLVDDVDALHAQFAASGAVDVVSSDGSPWASPADTPWGTREFHLRDPGGNSLQFYRLR